MSKTGFADLKARVIDRGLCCYCGSCAGSCPVGNIQMNTANGIGLPSDTGRCTACGLCLRVCPGAGVDLREISRRKLDAIDYPRGLGPYRRIILARAADETLRKSSTSGGAVTALLESALTAGKADLRWFLLSLYVFMRWSDKAFA